MAGFWSSCSHFPFWIKMLCFGVVCCLHLHRHIPLTLTLHPIAAHAFCTSPLCSSFAKAAVATVVRGMTDTRGEEHSGHPFAPVTSMTDTHRRAALRPPRLTSLLWGPELNARNMSSSVYLTLPVSAGASNVLNMNKNISFFNATEQNIGCREDCLWQK